MFVGREEELQALNALWKKDGASLVVCRGRRRIGKSTLIEQFAQQADGFFEFQGIAPRPGLGHQDQLDAFCQQLAKQTAVPLVKVDAWTNAFALLLNQIPSQKKTVVLLDEISWMALGDPDFAGQLKIEWDLHFKKKKKLILVLCGSVSSWIDKNILQGAGFLGRVSLRLNLRPLPLHQCALFWGKNHSRISSLEKLKILAVIGGIPRYLEEINPKEDTEATIRRWCFTPEGMLFNEFEQIFRDIFSSKAETYKNVVDILSGGAKTLTGISEGLGKERGGHLTEILKDLEMSGFVQRENLYRPGSSVPVKTPLFRLVDNYLRFYLLYIEPKKDNIRRGVYRKTPLQQIIAWESILGLQFETLVLNNLLSLYALLNISPGQITSAAPYQQKKTNRQNACQVDLLIQTKYTLYVCEMKCRQSIGLEVIAEVQRKVECLAIPKTHSVRPVLIYEGTLSAAVESEGYFDAIIPFTSFLRCQ